MNQLKDMSREELLEVIKIKDDVIRELRYEIDLYREMVRELQINSGTVPEGK